MRRRDAAMAAGNFQAVILDMDGVITHTAGVHARAWKEMFDAFLQRRSGDSFEPFNIEGDYRRYVDGRPRYDGVQNFLASRGIELPYGRETDGPECETVCGLGNRKNEIFQQLLQRDGVQVFPDAVRQIHRWKRQIGKVAVISASRNCEAVLTAANLATLFDVKVDGNDVARHNLQGKPAPDMFLSAAEQLGVEPAQAMVVEDAMAGVQAGKDGGFGLVIGVARDGARTDSRAVGADLRAAGADMVVGDLTEIELTADAENNGAP